MNEYLILVDENDVPQGRQEKLLAHQLGLLHRAFSVFIFNANGELLLQQRANEKYHSAGLWTNTCCSHPGFGENIKDAIERRMMQEMGMNCETIFAFSFIYKAQFENGLTEYEYDHVYFGVSDNLPLPNASEVKNWRYLNLEELKRDIQLHPGNYTEWLKICMPQMMQHFENIYPDNSMSYYNKVA
jgi:isopentenyl-diphosphate delta-isomerase